MAADAHGNLSGKRLVVFGCGYVGAALAARATQAGVRVTALTRNEATAHALRAQGIEVVVANLADSDWHQRIPAGPEYAVNCVSSGGAGLAGYRRSYVDGMRAIVDWARGAPVGTFVYTSSTSVYPQGKATEPTTSVEIPRVNESAPTEGARETGQVLLEAERLLRSAPAWRRYFILRLAGIYGPGRHHLLDAVREGTEEISGRGEHRLNLAHRDDIVAAIWAALLAPASVKDEIFNVADDEPATKAELMGWLAARLGRPAPRFSGVGHSARRAETPNRIIDNSKLKAMLGWVPVYRSFRDGYEKILSL
jgi:nucleoside-diphosphate-sugar epimerase